MKAQRAIRYHDISCGHRVVGHESKCRYIHGHNYRITFECVAERPKPVPGTPLITTCAELDAVGRVVDFSVMKSRLCLWLEDNWDHKLLIWERDRDVLRLWGSPIIVESTVLVPFNPTAENMAAYLLQTIGPRVLGGTECRLEKVTIEETRKCSATAEL